jgi:type I restriction enzyme S subunit
VAPGDLLIVRTNGSEELIGRSAVVIDHFERMTHFASYIIRFRLLGNANLWRWVRAFTESAVFRASVLSSIGSSAGQYNLSMSKLAAFPIAIPPDEEMVQALAVWQQRQGGIPDELEGASRELRRSVLAAAFRGELVQ